MKSTLETNSDGDQFWTFNDWYHREDGPAIVWANGEEEWYFKDELHREDGPALEYFNGNKSWYFYGNCHMGFHHNTKYWFINKASVPKWRYIYHTIFSGRPIPKFFWQEILK